MNWQKPPLGVQLNPGHPLSQGLVGCWLMNEGAGDNIFDSSAYRNNGSFTVGTSWGVSQRGGCLDFDGIDDYATIPDPDDLLYGSQNMSVAIWVQWDAKHASSSRLLAGKTSSDAWKLLSKTSGGGTVLKTTLLIRNDSVDTVTTLNADQWYFLVGTYDGFNKKIYLNGYLDNTTASSNRPPAASGSVILGGESGAGFVNCKVGMVAVWPGRTLTPSEIASLYADPYQMFRREPIELWTAATSVGAAPVATGFMTLNTGYWG